MKDEVRTGSGDTIKSDTFTPTGKHLGMGCWGVVDEYKDPVGQSWAIKRFCPNEVAVKQMAERGWTEEDVMRAEGLPLDASKYHLVPRVVERDRNGKLYVGMPVYDGGVTLQDKKTQISMGKDKTETRNKLGILRDIANALGYLHERPGEFFGIKRENVAHGDVKPSNIFVVDGHAFLGDLGSSSCISIGGHGSPRGTHGDVNYRAPECFANDAQPSKQADVWSLGAIAYELDTGKGIYDGLSADSMPRDELQREIRRRIGEASREIRPVLKKCLTVEPSDRFCNGNVALRDLEKRIEGLNGWAVARKHFGWAGPVAAAAAIMAGLIYAEATYEPRKLSMPTIQMNGSSPGLLYLNTETGIPRHTANPVNFDAESITNLHMYPPSRGAITAGVDRQSKLCTDNRTVAYLTKAAQWAWLSKEYSLPVITDEQQALYDSQVKGEERERQNSLSGPVYPVVANSLEYAINRSVKPDGKVDLEDTIAIARLGEKTVKMAKLRSCSDRFEAYRFAKYEDGTEVIPRKEREFIETTICYAEKDVDMILDSDEIRDLDRAYVKSHSK